MQVISQELFAEVASFDTFTGMLDLADAATQTWLEIKMYLDIQIQGFAARGTVATEQEVAQMKAHIAGILARQPDTDDFKRRLPQG